MILIVTLLTIILCISISAYRMARDIQRDLDDLTDDEPVNSDRIIIRGEGWEPIDGKEDEK